MTTSPPAVVGKTRARLRAAADRSGWALTAADDLDVFERTGLRVAAAYDGGGKRFAGADLSALIRTSANRISAWSAPATADWVAVASGNTADALRWLGDGS